MQTELVTIRFTWNWIWAAWVQSFENIKLNWAAEVQLSSCQKTRFAFSGQSEKLRKHSISEIVGLCGKSRPVLRRCFTCNVEKWPEHFTSWWNLWFQMALINPYDPFKHNIKFKMYCLWQAGLTNSLAKNLIETVLVTLRSGTQFCLKYLVHSFARAQSR